MFINGCLKHTTDVFVDVLCLKGIPKVYHSGRRRFGGECCTEAMMLSTRQRCRMFVDCCRTILEKRNPPPGHGDFCLEPRDVCLETDITQKDVALEHADFHSDVRHMCNQAG